MRTCFNQGEEEVPCTYCGHCEDIYFACSEDEQEFMDNMMLDYED